jgi:diguanylate cyclase (GGDEF)-like protein
MDVLRSAARIRPGPRQRAQPPEAELARLREQVAWLRAERAALWWAVGHDELTGLANRRLFSTLAPSLLGDGRPAVVIVVDLNGFKPINDTFGHEAGDLVLRIVAQRLAFCVGDDLVARLGGDEFTAVLTSAHRESPAQWWRPVVTTLSAAIAEPMPVAGQLLGVTASIGVATAHDEVRVDELLRRADRAMYHAKASGGSYAAWDTRAVNDDRPPAPSTVPRGRHALSVSDFERPQPYD